jgi:hypothetical protein
MNIYSDFSKNIFRIREMAYNEIRNYRHPLRKLALQFISSHKLLDEDLSPKGIVFYLPLWLGTQFKIDSNSIEQLSLANFFVALSVDIKDEVKDKLVNDYKLVLLSDRLLISAVEIFRVTMGENKSFWTYFNDCLDQNINIRINENEITAVETPINKPIDSKRFLSKYYSVCEGGAFLRPAAIACAILARKENQIQHLSNAIDLYHIGLKIIDDYLDWEEDLEYDSQSLFLNCVREWVGYKNIQKLDIQKFIVGSDTTEKMITEAIKCTESAKKKIINFDNIYFSTFLDNQQSWYIYLKDQLISSKTGIKRKILHELHIDSNANNIS